MAAQPLQQLGRGREARLHGQRPPYDARADVATQVRQSFDSSLQHLRTDYVDSLILRGPSQGRGLFDEDWQAWQAMEELQRAGKARLIGASNVSLEQLQALHRGAAVTPAFVQNRCFARTGWDRMVRKLCRSHGIAYQGFSLLTANARELHQPAVLDVARRVGRRHRIPAMKDRFAAARLALEEAVLRGPGHTDPDLRQRVAERRDVPEELRALLDKIERQAYQVTDEDLVALRARYTDDQRFEIVVAAALGSALVRLRAGLGALEQA